MHYGYGCCCGFDCGSGCCGGRWGNGCGGYGLDNYAYDVGPGWHGCGYQGGHPSCCGCARCGRGGFGFH
uniref:Keratin-associated protein 21-1-like n=1 Tax=Mesocestoides corti TaxID=53468 RepID=A0A5K3EM97_MESCO